MTQKYNCSDEVIAELKPNEIFVFGSNLNGAHGGGAARLAKDKFGAKNGAYLGHTGLSYAIPTLDSNFNKLSIWAITIYVEIFIDDAARNPDKMYLVTEIGCGIAGFKISEIAPLFHRVMGVDNVKLPLRFILYNRSFIGKIRLFFKNLL